MSRKCSRNLLLITRSAMFASTGLQDADNFGGERACMF